MKIKVLFNSEKSQEGLLTGWGISCLVDGHILFDTGEKGEWLLSNLRTLDVDVMDIDTVVISHDHWDHTGGLWDILERKPGLPVYGCEGFAEEFKQKVKAYKGKIIENNKIASVAQGIYVTGEISGFYKGNYLAEQALIIETNKGISVITGCAHPGIIKMLECIKEEIPDKSFYAVIGGFHLLKRDRRETEWVISQFKKMGVKKAGPTHCSGKDAEKMFQDVYGKNFISEKVGDMFEV